MARSSDGSDQLPDEVKEYDWSYRGGRGVRVAPTWIPMTSPDTTNSTRRFCCRPEAVSLEVTGCVLPNPRALSEFIEMP